MTKLEYVLDFCKEYGKEMLASGSNIERVTLLMEKICHAYGLHDVTCNNLTSRIFISAKDENGNYADRQTHVHSQSINLEKIKKLNNLSYIIRDTTPNPETLRDLLFDIKTTDFPWWVMLIAFVVAMSGLCRIFQGGIQELALTIAHTLALFGLSKLFAKIELNKIITNFVCMFLCSCSAMLFYKIGFIQNYFIVAITNAFYLIPGIPLVNSVRNILCGHEQNGIIDLLKVLLEGLSIVAGVAAAYALLSSVTGNVLLEESILKAPNTWISNIELTFLTMMASAGFSIVFNIQLKDVPLAALGGGIVRIILILTSLVFPSEYSFLSLTLAAFAAALYSEILANINKEPSTVFLYPSIIPLIPGDLLYYFALGLVWKNGNLVTKYGPNLLLSLVGISIGFVVCSSFMHYIRKFKFFKISNKLN